MKAERRHHRERLKKARRFHWGRDLRGEDQQIGLAVDTPTPCSCPMCGNPRKFFGDKSIQERSAEGLFRRLGFDG
jgi:hypothetical protein